MNLRHRSVQTAVKAMRNVLQQAAEKQHAYFACAKDGRISLELEGLELGALAKAIVSAYLQDLQAAKRKTRA